MARGFGGETTEQEARGIDNSAATDSSMASVASGRADAATSAALGGRDVDPGGGGDNDGVSASLVALGVMLLKWALSIMDCLRRTARPSLATSGSGSVCGGAATIGSEFVGEGSFLTTTGTDTCTFSTGTDVISISVDLFRPIDVSVGS